MKKTTTITAVTFFAIAVISCSRSSSDYLPSMSTSQVSTTAQPVKVRLISDWQSLSMTTSTVSGVSQLDGQSTLTQIVSYETGMHKQLAYIKSQGREGFSYKSLPTTYSTTDGNHAINFSLSFSTFNVSISNNDFPARLVNAQTFTYFQYMYIIIPIEIYQSTQVDWNDLPAVASALGFSL